MIEKETDWPLSVIIGKKLYECRCAPGTNLTDEKTEAQIGPRSHSK